MGYQPQAGELLELRCDGGGWGKAEIKYLSPTVCVWLWIREDGGYQIEHSERPDKIEFRPVRHLLGLAVPGFDEPLRLGDRCEYFTDGKGAYWCPASVAYLGSHMVIIKYDHPVNGAQESCICHAAKGDAGLETRLRPARTGAQIASEEREASIRKAMNRTHSLGHSDVSKRILIERLYDTGCLKAVPND